MWQFVPARQQAGFRCQENKSANSDPYMKLRQNGIVSFSIRLAVFLARGRAYMQQAAQLFIEIIISDKNVR
jgi:hypothetical protein